MKGSIAMNTITLPAQEIPVKGHYDAIVIGGGTAGAFAGIAAAKRGLRTLIIEQFGALGGSASVGLVTPLMSTHMPGYRGHSPLSEELVKKLREIDGTGVGEEDDYYFDCTAIKSALEMMVSQSGCELLYHTAPVKAVVESGKLKYLVVNNKDGLVAFSADYFVDCTGDADVAAMAGVPYEQGNHEGVNQPVSLRFEMANIDFDSFHAYMKKLGNNAQKYFAMNTPGMKEILQKACDDGLLTKQDICYFQAFLIPGRPNGMNFNCPELTTKAGVCDADFITQKQIEGKAAILRLKRFLNERIPGFENAYITEIAPFVGFRESRRIKASYVMTIKDILSYKKFDDAIVKCKYPLDVHGVEDVTLGLKYDESLPTREQYWEVPFSCMVTNELENLLVSGRCAGFDFRAQSAARIQLVCRSMGEAAGIGCAVAKKQSRSFKELDGSLVRKELFI